MLSKFSRVLAYSYSALLLLLSLIKIGPVIPKLGSDFDDKLYHAVAYMIMSFVWGIYLIQRFKKNYNLLSFFIGGLFYLPIWFANGLSLSWLTAVTPNEQGYFGLVARFVYKLILSLTIISFLFILINASNLNS